MEEVIRAHTERQRKRMDQLVIANSVSANGQSFVIGRAASILSNPNNKQPISFEMWLSKKLNMTIKSEDVIIKL